MKIGNYSFKLGIAALFAGWISTAEAAITTFRSDSIPVERGANISGTFGPMGVGSSSVGEGEISIDAVAVDLGLDQFSFDFAGEIPIDVEVLTGLGQSTRIQGAITFDRSRFGFGFAERVGLDLGISSFHLDELGDLSFIGGSIEGSFELSGPTETVMGDFSVPYAGWESRNSRSDLRALGAADFPDEVSLFSRNSSDWLRIFNDADAKLISTTVDGIVVDVDLASMFFEVSDMATFTRIPEPSSASLLLGGLIAIAAGRRRAR